MPNKLLHASCVITTHLTWESLGNPTGRADKDLTYPLALPHLANWIFRTFRSLTSRDSFCAAYLFLFKIWLAGEPGREGGHGSINTRQGPRERKLSAELLIPSNSSLPLFDLPSFCMVPWGAESC